MNNWHQPPLPHGVELAELVITVGYAARHGIVHTGAVLREPQGATLALYAWPVGRLEASQQKDHEVHLKVTNTISLVLDLHNRWSEPFPPNSDEVWRAVHEHVLRLAQTSQDAHGGLSESPHERDPRHGEPPVSKPAPHDS